MGLWIDPEESVDFEAVLVDGVPAPGRQPVLSRAGPVVDLGAGAEFLPSGSRGLLFGVRAGYLAAPFTSGWHMYEHSVSGGPDASISGPYVRVAVGWAWTR